MTDQRKRLTKAASKLLFEIICEDEFQGKKIKDIIPSSRRISKKREGLWEFIQAELVRRSGENYDMGTLSAAWYYNLRKIGSCLDQIDMSLDENARLERMRTLDRYICNNLGDRVGMEGEGSVMGAAAIEEEGEGEGGDMKMSAAHLLALSRQDTLDVSQLFVPNLISLLTMGVDRNVTLTNMIEVKKEKESPREKRKRMDETAMEEMEEEEERRDGNGRRDEMGVEDGLDVAPDHGDHPIPPPLLPTEESAVETGAGMEESAFVAPLPSRYNTANSVLISRNNSTQSVSGYDADTEKGQIARQRKLKTRAERERIVKEEEEGEEKEEEEMEEGRGEEEHRHDEQDDAEEGAEIVEGERESGEIEEDQMITHLKGMIHNLRDHIISLRINGVIDGGHMESLADSFEHAANSISNNLETL